ncbi:MAG: asparaginase [Acetobacteraceae bacterium]|nr:asparaginase [Acetobacteraceae bacterium]
MIDPVLVEVSRGGTVESAHRGAAIVVDAEGAVLFACGDVDRPVFPRSAVKALQALALVESGIADRYGLSGQELALASASHSGEPLHVATAASMLAKAGRDEAALECGAHWPSVVGEAVQKFAATGARPTALHNNCSGKHAGMVCLACGQGIDPAGYIDRAHPVQRRIAEVLGEVTGAPIGASTPCGTDGCSIPTFAFPLRALALAFARLGSGHGLARDRALAAARLRQAVAENPFFVAGTDRFDTRAMTLLGAKIFTKTGAEGVHCAAFPEAGLGAAVKCADGAGRASEVMIASLIARFVPMSEAEAAQFRPFRAPVLKNWNGIEVGALAAAGPLAG